MVTKSTLHLEVIGNEELISLLLLNQDLEIIFSSEDCLFIYSPSALAYVTIARSLLLCTQLSSRQIGVVGGGDWSEDFFHVADDASCVLLFVRFEQVEFLAV